MSMTRKLQSHLYPPSEDLPAHVMPSRVARSGSRTSSSFAT
jgi:hypothetical protein